MSEYATISVQGNRSKAFGLVTRDSWYVIGPEEPSGRREIISLGPLGHPQRKSLGFYAAQDAKVAVGAPVNLLGVDEKTLALSPPTKIITHM